MNSRAKLINGEFINIPIKKFEKDNVITIIPDITDWKEIEYLDLCYDFGNAKVGDNGYFALARGTNSPDDHIVCYEDRPNAEIDACNFQMNFIGYVKNGSGWCMIPTGLTYEFHAIIGKKDDTYYAYPRFYIGGKEPYETIRLEYHMIDRDADYSKICRIYREYMLENKGCKPIKDRLNDELEYAKDSIYIRIRMGWKPVPSPVDEQTIETEPEMHVAMTFDEVGVLCDKLKAAGVKKAELCLVGWNVSGHDGRWPQIFPVEPKLGGEEGLKRLIKKANELGYQITCHTNCTDSYSIADNYSSYWTLKDKNGNIVSAGRWGGGLGKKICPLKEVEYVKTELPKVRELGFKGLHYIDVVSTIPLLECCDKNHPVNRAMCRELWEEVAKYCKDEFGGFSSEGCYDFIADNLDYGLYTSFYNTDSEKPTLFSKSVPLWQIVYHGIILSNPYTSTVNSPIKSRKHQLEVMERGGRPTIYIYSKFLSSGSNWMGNDDITCNDEADTERTVKLLADMYREFEPLTYLQTEFIEKHEEENGISKTYYSDGSVMTCDFNNGTYSLKKPQ